MTPKKQRIAVAEACGWKVHPELEYGRYGTVDKRKHPDFPDREPAYEKDGALCRASGLPDYLNDLNAVHEAEKTLDDGVLWRGYLNRLWEVVCPERNQMNGLDAATGLLLVHATAAQRAEAFLKTLGLWED